MVSRETALPAVDIFHPLGVVTYPPLPGWYLEMLVTPVPPWEQR